VRASEVPPRGFEVQQVTKAAQQFRTDAQAASPGFAASRSASDLRTAAERREGANADASSVRKLITLATQLESDVNRVSADGDRLQKAVNSS
jgi:phosphotransferase system HPr-like phosphotransfer protein